MSSQGHIQENYKEQERNERNRNIYIYIYIYIGCVQIIPGVIFGNGTSLNNFLLEVYFDKTTIGLHFLLIPSMFAKFQDNKRSIGTSLIKCLNFKFLIF